MRPLAYAALGLVPIAVDVRTEKLDLLPDALGWLLVAYAAWRLAMRLPAVLASVAAVLSLADLSLPYEWVLFDATGRRITTGRGVEGISEQLEFLGVGWVRVGLLAVALAAGAAALWLLVVPRSMDAPRRERSLVMGLTVAFVATFVVPQLAGMALSGGHYDAVWNGAAATVGLVGSLVALALAVDLWRVADDRWALPPAAPLRDLRGVEFGSHGQ